MSWDYRVIRRIVQDQPWYGIYEVYYNAQGEIEAYTQEPIPFVAESWEELRLDLPKIRRAFSRPLLHWERLPHSSEDL